MVTPQQPTILASLLDHCWEPQSAIEDLRGQIGGPHGQLAHAVCLLVPEGDAAKARVVTESERIDDTLPPGRTRYLWVLAVKPPSRETLLGLCGEHVSAAGVNIYKKICKGESTAYSPEDLEDLMAVDSDALRSALTDVDAFITWIENEQQAEFERLDGVETATGLAVGGASGEAGHGSDRQDQEQAV